MSTDQATLSRDQWAWEFLRRNPQYQADYRQFITIWLALEADYGAPPNRDFQRWKRDARAYGPLPGSSAGDQPDTASGDLCVSEDERVFLECWMGAKWGFNKFPLDPHCSLPPAPEALGWRTLPARPAHDIDEAYRLELAFDLSLPLPQQLDAAKFRLASRVAELRRAGHAAPLSVTSQRDYWAQLIGALDAPAAAPEALLATAQKMAESGYREILRLAE